MQYLHETTVLPEEIDSLGHMNVRYYMARMERANRILLQDHPMFHTIFDSSKGKTFAFVADGHSLLRQNF